MPEERVRALPGYPSSPSHGHAVAPRPSTLRIFANTLGTVYRPPPLRRRGVPTFRCVSNFRICGLVGNSPNILRQTPIVTFDISAYCEIIRTNCIRRSPLGSGTLPFGRREWLEAICRDPGVSALQFRIAYALSGMMSAEGRLRARLIEIAAKSGTTGPSVRGALFRLAERGFLVIRLDKQQVAIAVPRSIPRRTPEPAE